ncbi:MAG: Putative transmembrane protein [Burkholderiaceae bacterium]|jgi:Tfp pilus assembly protein PilE|nr:MAG: Putative transmembrane protein [Burkholderiaceae bacterium]
MELQRKSRQRGLSFIGLVFVVAVLVFVGVMAAQVIPTALEYQEILRAANKAAHEGNTVVEIRQIFDKAADINNITAIAGKDLDITKNDDKIVVSFAYNKEIHMVGPAYLLLKYAGQSN